MSDADLPFRPPEAPPPGEPLPAVVLVSGGGTTLQNLLNEQRHGSLPIDIRLVISSRDDAFALERARRAGIETRVLRPADHDGPDAYGAAIVEALAPVGPKLVCMAGFLHFWTIPEHLLGRVLNIHPSLLPAFGGRGMYGDRVHRAVLEYGCRVSGCTVHLADNVYDHGPVLVQRVIHVLEGDTVQTLRARVFREECIAYPQAIRLIAEGRIAVEGRSVKLVPPKGSGRRSAVGD
jgi:formyltetrahydrofolate-dependent phosphoribosylglycinamide formyltransferase